MYLCLTDVYLCSNTWYMIPTWTLICTEIHGEYNLYYIFVQMNCSEALFKCHAVFLLKSSQGPKRKMEGLKVSATPQASSSFFLGDLLVSGLHNWKYKSPHQICNISAYLGWRIIVRKTGRSTGNGAGFVMCFLDWEERCMFLMIWGNLPGFCIIQLLFTNSARPQLLKKKLAD